MYNMYRCTHVCTCTCIILARTAQDNTSSKFMGGAQHYRVVLIVVCVYPTTTYHVLRGQLVWVVVCLSYQL